MGRSVWQEREEGLRFLLLCSLFEIFNQIVGVVVGRVKSLGVFRLIRRSGMQSRSVKTQ